MDDAHCQDTEQAMKINHQIDKQKIPLVSVIVPVYNSEKYLDECLYSIVYQSYENIEIIAVNDGSTDSSRDILGKWQVKDKRISVYDRENQGQAAARNFGLDKSHGETIMFADSDDVLYRHAIEELLRVKCEEGVRIVCGLMCDNLKKLGRSRKDGINIYSGVSLAERILYQTSSVTVSPCAQLFDKSVFNKGNRFKEGLYYEDLELVPRIYVAEARIAVLEKNIYYYRQHDTSFIHKFTCSRFDSLKATASLLEKVAPLSDKLHKAVTDRILSASFNVLILVGNKSEYKGETDLAWANIKKYRRQSFFNSKVRLKNKIGILMSLCGRSIFRHIVAY